jgi:hypothetical protein
MLFDKLNVFRKAYLKSEEYKQFQSDYIEVGKMLTGLIKRWSSKSSSL